MCSQPYVPLNLCLVSNLAALWALREGVRGLAAFVGCRDGERWLASCSSELEPEYLISSLAQSGKALSVRGLESPLVQEMRNGG